MDPTLEHALLDQPLVRTVLANPPRPNTVKRVDFAQVLMPEAIDTQLYQMMLSHEMGRDVAVLLPNHKERPLLWAREFRSLRRWHKTLNKLFVHSPEDEEYSKLYVVYGKHIYECKHLSGRVYLFWAYINCGNSVLGTQLPVLVNCDGKLQPKAVMILGLGRIPITHTSPVFKWDWKLMEGHPFVCEERHPSQRQVQALPSAQRERDARYDLTRSAAPLHVRPMLMHNPFERSIDYEDVPVPLNPTTSADDSGISLDMEDAMQLRFTRSVIISNKDDDT